MRKKSIKETIKGYFYVNPTARLRVREIEKTLQLPLPSVIRYCRELEQEEILAKVSVGSVSFYTADRSSKNFLLEKKLHNIKSLYSSGLVDFLREELSNPSIIIFGSYAKGEDLEDSDIDLYIETPSKKQVDLHKFEKITSRKIQLFIYKNIHEIKNKALANNIINGFLLNGFIEVFT